MKVTATFGNLTVEVEGNTQTDVWEQLADFQEVFTNVCPVTKDGKPSDNLKYVVREVDGNKYFELRCQDAPYARLSFGQHKKGGSLFPKRKDGDGNYLPDNGWTVYRKEEK